jgi:Lar family restriction alleviation protein
MSLAPCPFCSELREVSAQQIALGVWAVCCETCNTIGPHRDGPHPKDAAVKAWNQRALAAAQGGGYDWRGYP